MGRVRRAALRLRRPVPARRAGGPGGRPADADGRVHDGRTGGCDMTKSLKLSVREERVVHKATERTSRMTLTNYFITVGGRTYYVWRDDDDTGTAVFAYYQDGPGKITNFEFIPYRD